MVPPAEVSATSVLCRVREAAWRDIAGEMVVLDSARNVIRGLNRTGGLAWSLVDGKRTAAEIAHEIAQSTAAPEDQVLVDLVAFLTRLLELGLVEPAPSDVR